MQERIVRIRESGQLAEFRELRTRLEEAILLANRAADRVRARMSDAIDALTQHAELLAVEPDLVRLSLTEIICPQPTDNLILHSILRHAAGNTEALKAFFTQNMDDFLENDGRDRLRASGINPLLATEAALTGWLGAHRPQP
jgi:hypothetical protein